MSRLMVCHILLVLDEAAILVVVYWANCYRHCLVVLVVIAIAAIHVLSNLDYRNPNYSILSPVAVPIRKESNRC